MHLSVEIWDKYNKNLIICLNHLRQTYSYLLNQAEKISNILSNRLFKLFHLSLNHTIILAGEKKLIFKYHAYSFFLYILWKNCR